MGDNERVVYLKMENSFSQCSLQIGANVWLKMIIHLMLGFTVVVEETTDRWFGKGVE